MCQKLQWSFPARVHESQVSGLLGLDNMGALQVWRPREQSVVARACKCLTSRWEAHSGMWKENQALLKVWNFAGGVVQWVSPVGKFVSKLRQIWPWSTEWSRAKANRLLPRECTGHSKHSLLTTTLEKTLHMNITRWSTLKSDGLYSLQPKMEKLYPVSKNKTGSWLWLRSWTPYCQIQT